MQIADAQDEAKKAKDDASAQSCLLAEQRQQLDVSLKRTSELQSQVMDLQLAATQAQLKEAATVKSLMDRLDEAVNESQDLQKSNKLLSFKLSEASGKSAEDSENIRNLENQLHVSSSDKRTQV